MLLSPSQIMCFLNGISNIFRDISLDMRERLLIYESSILSRCIISTIMLSSSRERAIKDIWRYLIAWNKFNSKYENKFVF